MLDSVAWRPSRCHCLCLPPGLLAEIWTRLCCHSPAPLVSISTCHHAPRAVRANHWLRLAVGGSPLWQPGTELQMPPSQLFKRSPMSHAKYETQQSSAWLKIHSSSTWPLPPSLLFFISKELWVPWQRSSSPPLRFSQNTAHKVLGCQSYSLLYH